jgi:hypothetical protein
MTSALPPFDFKNLPSEVISLIAFVSDVIVLLLNLRFVLLLSTGFHHRSKLSSDARKWGSSGRLRFFQRN